MKLQFVLYLSIFTHFSSFSIAQACAYAGSNITFVETETEKALAEKDLQLMRFHIYRALGAISKSDKPLGKCGCGDATERISEASAILKKAARTTSIGGTRVLLEKALQNTQEGLEALNNHGSHDSDYGTDDLQFNTTGMQANKKPIIQPDDNLLRHKIDSALTQYRASLDEVVRTVNCKEALAYATRIYEHCEQQLLCPELSEGKKYYNLRTKEITAEALEILGDCR